MRNLESAEIDSISGGESNAAQCANAIMASGGIGSIAGAIIGGAIGSVIPVVGTAAGAAVGSGLGALFGGGYTSANGAACQG